MKPLVTSTYGGIQGGEPVLTTIQRTRRREDNSKDVGMQVRRALQRHPYRLLRTLFVEYEKGVVVLRGRLPSYYQKQLAQEAMRGIDGVTHVVNEVEVSPPHPR